MTLKEALDQFEKETISRVWDEHNGSPIGTSLALGLDRRSLFARMERYGMHVKPVRKPRYRLSLTDLIRQRERELLVNALREHGTRREAAMALGISELTIHNKMARHSIESDAIKEGGAR